MEIVAVLLLMLWLFPGMLAHNRNHVNAVAITVLTATLGWTIIGWCIALTWACTDNTRKA